jgi:hypothetical protein
VTISTQTSTYEGEQIRGQHQRRMLTSCSCHGHKGRKRCLCLWKSYCRRGLMPMLQTGKLIWCRCDQDDQNRNYRENSYRFGHNFHSTFPVATVKTVRHSSKQALGDWGSSVSRSVPGRLLLKYRAGVEKGNQSSNFNSWTPRLSGPGKLAIPIPSRTHFTSQTRVHSCRFCRCDDRLGEVATRAFVS